MKKQPVNVKKRGTKSHFYVLCISLVVLITLVACFAKTIITSMNLGLDLQGGFEIAYQVSPLSEDGELPEMSAVVSSIQKRINVLGVSEPEITIEGNDQIRVQLAGVKDQDEARKVISSTANLTFRDSSDNLLMDASVLEEGGASLEYQDGEPVVSLKIKDQTTFYEVTSTLASSSDNTMVVWLDFDAENDSYAKELAIAQAGGTPAYVSAATVSSGISGDAVISGNFTDSTARTLANLINSGSLPVKLTEIYSNVVSAELGTSAYQKTMVAGGIGILLVMLFMIIRYRVPGIISACTLAFYVFAVLGIYKLMGGVFTLPGIAALILGVGMSVDSNIITFERLKEELYAGRPLSTAITNSQKMSLSAIVDAQLTTFIAAFIMYIFGTGSVKGFATMLMVSLVCTALISILFMRFLMSELGKSKVFEHKLSWFNVKTKLIPNLAKGEKTTYQNPFRKVNFMKLSKYFVSVSCIILVLFLVLFGVRKANNESVLNLGIDFSSGTRITITSDETLTTEAVTAEFESLGYTPSRVQLTGDNNNGASVTIKDAIDSDSLTTLKASLAEYYGHEASDSVVTPTVGRSLVKNAVYLTLLAWLCMLVYISIRFRWDTAIGCIISLMHDVLMVFCVFAIAGFEINSNLIAVFLAIIGYSINNSIVVFDRLREEQKTIDHQLNKQELYNLVNTTLSMSFTRTISSTITTILPVLALLVLGSSSIFTFTFALLVGLISGSVSSTFISMQIWYLIKCHEKPKKIKKKKVRKHDELEEYSIPGINDIR